MIHEVIDTAITLGWWLLAWIAVAAAVGTVVLLTGVALGTWAWRTARRRVACPSWARGALRARIRARSRRRRPQDRTDDQDYQEAA